MGFINQVINGDDLVAWGVRKIMMQPAIVGANGHFGWLYGFTSFLEDPNSVIDPKYQVARGRGIMIISQDVPVMTGM